MNLMTTASSRERQHQRTAKIVAKLKSEGMDRAPIRQVELMIRQVVTSRPDLLKAFVEKNQPSKELAESRARVKIMLQQVGLESLNNSLSQVPQFASHKALNLSVVYWLKISQALEEGRYGSNQVHPEWETPNR